MAIKKTVLDDFFAEESIASPQETKQYSRYKIYEEPNKVRTKGDGWKKTNGKQTVNKRVTEPVTNGKQTVNKRVTEPITERLTNGKQNAELDITPTPISSLVGLQRKIIFILYQSCKLVGGNITQEMTLEHIAASINAHKNTIKTTINRLKQKTYIGVHEYKDGRAGWVKYKLPQSVYVDLLRHEGLCLTNINGKQTVNKRVTEPVTEPVTKPPSSSSYTNNKTTTELPAEWLDIDLTPLENVGFTKHYLEQLYKTITSSASDVQASIEHFAFDLNENNKRNEIKTNPLSFFMGIMKRSGLYLAPGNYESPRDKAMREFVEKSRNSEELRQKRIKELKMIEYSKWLDSLTDDELVAIAPKALKEGRDRLSGMSTGVLLTVFNEKIWPNKRMELIDLFG